MDLEFECKSSKWKGPKGNCIYDPEFRWQKVHCKPENIHPWDASSTYLEIYSKKYW